MRAGALKERLTLQAAVPVSDPVWGEVEEWQSIATVWASVLPQAAGERTDGQGVQSHTTYTVRIRYRDDITSANRLLWRGRELAIASAQDMEGKRRELVIAAVHHPQRPTPAPAEPPGGEQ